MPTILFLTDNKFIFHEIFNYMKELELEHEKYDFACSPQSSLVDYNTFIKEVDVKAQIDQLLKKYDFIISAHCKQFFPRKLVQTITCINIHPGYNPLNRGWFPQVFALNYNIDVGATIHVMDEKLDHGPVLAREKVKKYTWDTSETLYKRILKKEIKLFKQVFPEIISERIHARKVSHEEENFFSKRDFNDLCHLNMKEEGRFEDFYNKLRALTHGEYKNAYFIDQDTGKKVYVSLNIECKNEGKT